MNVRTEKKSFKTSGISGTNDTKFNNDVASAVNVDKNKQLFFLI
jgi:hypothetical protein